MQSELAKTPTGGEFLPHGSTSDDVLIAARQPFRKPRGASIAIRAPRRGAALDLHSLDILGDAANNNIRRAARELKVVEQKRRDLQSAQ